MYKDISENYLHLQGWMMTKLKLSGNELLAFGLIYGFTQDGASVYHGSLNYLQTWLNVTRPTAIKALKSLVNKKYLIKQETIENNVKYCTYQANIALVKNAIQGSKESLQGSKESLQGGSKESLQGGSKESLHNNTNLNNTKREIGERAHFLKSNKEKVSNEYTSKPDVKKAGRNQNKHKKNSVGKNYTHENKDKLSAFEFIKQQRPNDFKKDFQDRFSHRIKDKHKFKKSFNNKIVIENLPFDSDILLARLDNYAMNWVKNDNKLDQQNQSNNNRISTIPIISHAK